jgi:hypothetical protein
MTIDLRWLDNQQTALLYTFPEKWTWDDFYAVKAQADVWLDACDHDVVLLFDMSVTRTIPPGALSQGRYLIGKAHPRGKPIILIGGNRMIAALLNMAARFNPNLTHLIRTAPTFDEAHKFVAQPNP